MFQYDLTCSSIRSAILKANKTTFKGESDVGNGSIYP